MCVSEARVLVSCLHGIVPGYWRGLVLCAGDGSGIERDKGVRWMPWRQEAMKDVARCDKLRGDASDR